MRLPVEETVYPSLTTATRLGRPSRWLIATRIIPITPACSASPPYKLPE